MNIKKKAVLIVSLLLISLGLCTFAMADPILPDTRSLIITTEKVDTTWTKWTFDISNTVEKDFNLRSFTVALGSNYVAEAFNQDSFVGLAHRAGETDFVELAGLSVEKPAGAANKITWTRSSSDTAEKMYYKFSFLTNWTGTATSSDSLTQIKQNGSIGMVCFDDVASPMYVEPIPAVPEPSSVLALFSGLVSVGFVFRKRKA